jgi:hypothetical protein
MRWDERYAPYLERARFLHLARAIVAGLPRMDGALLSAFVDHWRPETHTFHLPCGEMAPLMQDVGYILGLRINGVVVSGTINTNNWKEMMHEFTGHYPQEPEEGKEKKTSSVSSKWLKDHFNECPEHADDEVVQRHARVWLWHMVASFLLPDASGNTVSWMCLPQLREEWENIALYSWGSATLAWLYHQLCEACRRASPTSNLGGCTYLLQIWIWERIPIGRTHKKTRSGECSKACLYLCYSIICS